VLKTGQVEFQVPSKISIDFLILRLKKKSKMSQPTHYYRENYQKLKNIAETMRDQEEPDIDQLVAMVAEATEAYKNCQARIEAVEKALELKNEEST
jgi:exodeoxyribonuclease VII small subunit